MATPTSNRHVHVEFDRVDQTGPMTVPNTGGWTTWQTLSVDVALDAGRQVMRLVIDVGGVNVDQISLTNVENETIWYGNYGIEDDADLRPLSGYTTITGDLSIVGWSVTRLDDLIGLTSIGGSLGIEVYTLKTLDGLENLTSIGGNLSVNGTLADCDPEGFGCCSVHSSIESMSGLRSVKRIGGGLYIFCNGNLSELGMNGLSEVGSDFKIYSNALSQESVGALRDQVLDRGGIGGEIDIASP